MLAIPLPFIAALLLFITGVLLRCRCPHTGQKPFWFIMLCALMITMVGLRWVVDIALFRFLQPILGASIPVAAWLCFSGAHRNKTSSKLHWIGPITVLVGGLLHQHIWVGSVDILLILLYFTYGSLLLKSSFSTPERVRLSDVSRVEVAERVAGGLLLFSALVDAALSYDILWFNAQHSNLILSIGYLVLIPVIVAAVIVISVSTPVKDHQASPPISSPQQIDTTVTSTGHLDKDQVQAVSNIMAKFDALMREQQVFTDPDLTLDRLSRKLGIQARKISSAVNQVHNQNISKVINTYRIEHAKMLLQQSDDTITDIFLSSGFHTKSNFNREFLRITGQTPSEFRRLPPE
ncbi:AraC family transcriptional regulator [Vibrio neptunius]|uniref:helix-turn-helix domain-containing protein n=1 Tax=Vibrio neptunius TaxID=170651 RepID=UPI0005FA2661|nr:helix-turn-helix domain-containing protein [Vibrio neptunius]KJY89392.1 AraC family transcriptional regulator [Vibrio neptunius]